MKVVKKYKLSVISTDDVIYNMMRIVKNIVLSIGKFIRVNLKCSHHREKS